MQQIQHSSWIQPQPELTKFSVRQRLLSGSVTLAMTGGAGMTAAMAHTAAPTPAFSGGPLPLVHSIAATPGAATPLVHSLHPVVTNAASHHGWTAASSTVKAAVTTTPSADDIDLSNSTAIFPASSLAGYNTITIDIGGHETKLNSLVNLTGAELVAAEQVASGGKQTLTVNSSGVATGGTVNLNRTMVNGLDGALKGNIADLDISKGVTAVDTLSNLSLSGSLSNQGKIDVGGAGQTLDTISAGSITNNAGASINGVSGTAVALSASDTFTSSGKVTAGGDLSISAPTLNNSGLLSSSGGNVNLSGGGGNLTVNGAGGTVEAARNINIDTSVGNGNITASGGNWISQNLNFNAGSGNVTADVGEVSGLVNVTAGCAHVTASTANLQLGDMNVSGDPTYFNTGNITITGTSAFNTDTAIVASGNIIGSGGTLQITNAGSALTLVAGANFQQTGGTSSSNTSGGGDPTTPVTLTDSANAGLGSKTGGFIDLSGNTLGGKGTPVTGASISTDNGNITMIAYKGTGSNSGSVVGTGTIKSGGANTINAGTGDVIIIGGGAQLTAQNITGNNVSILGGTPTLGGTTLTITGGVLSAAEPWSVLNSKPSNTAVNITNVTASSNATISTAGKLTVATGGVLTTGAGSTLSLTFGSNNSTSKAPIAISATSLNVNGTTATGSIFLNETAGTVVNLFGNSTLGSGATLGISSISGVNIVNGVVVSAGTINISDNSVLGIYNTGGLLSGGTINLTESGAGFINVNTAANVLSASSTGEVVINESASSAKSLTVNTSSSVGDFILTSTQTVNVKGSITSTSGGDIDLTETGSTNAVGLSIGAVLTAGSNNINLTTTGTDTITASKTITATDLTISAGGTVGGTAGLPTNVSGLLTLNGSSVNNALINIKDAGTVALNVLGSETGGQPQPVTISSVAATVNLGDSGAGSLLFSGVTVTDTATVAKVPATINIDPGFGNTIGDGSGAVKITAAGSISQTNTGGLSGSSITLSSSTANIGSGTAVVVGSGVGTAIVTANATKGTVALNAVSNISLNTGTSGTYTVDSAANSVNILGTITGNAKTGAFVTIDAPIITQGSTTAFLVSPTVTLETIAIGQIGVGPGAQSIQTKATTALNIEGAADSTAFVTQNGTINLGAASTITAPGGSSTLNLFMAPGNTLTVSTPITWDNNNITATSTVTVAAGGISGASVTITSPSVVVNMANGINANGEANFISTSGLSITGTSGGVTVGAGGTLNLSGTSSITLGTAGSVASDPLNALINGNTLGSLSIASNGAFTGAYSQFTTGTTLSVTVSSIKNTGSAPANSFDLTSGFSVTLALNGAVTLGSAAGQYELTATQNGGTFISASATGILTANTSGLVFAGTNNNIALKGSNLNTNALDATYFTTDNTFNSVALTATSGTFIVGATGMQLNNGIAGNISTGFAQVTAPTGITVNSGFQISADVMLFNTSNFKLNGTSSIVGVGSGFLTIASSSGLTIGGTGGPNNIGGTYTGISAVTLQAATGGVNVGNLFTATNGTGNMLDSGTVNEITISAAQSVTLPSLIANGMLQVSSSGDIFLSAASISYSPAAGQPTRYLTLSAAGGEVDLNLTPTTPATAILTLGKAAGAIDINVGSGGFFTASSTGSVVVNEPQSVSGAEVNGLNVTFNQSVSATGGVGVIASGSPISTITEAPGVTLSSSGGFVGLSQGLQTLPTTALVVNAPEVEILQGALNILNTFSGNSSLSAVSNALLPLIALNYVATSGTSSSTLTVEGNIVATAGGISITNTNGALVVGSNTLLQTAAGSIMVPAGTDGTKAGPPGTFVSAPTMGGNIVLQNNDINGSIEIGSGASISAFGMAGSGLGNVFITKGVAPTVGLAAGTQPTPFPPLVTTSGGGAVFYTTTANPSGSIMSGQGNQLKALGANIVFNGAGNSSYISLDSDVTITADPPASGASSAAQAAVTPAVNVLSPVVPASIGASGTLSTGNTTSTVSSPNAGISSIGLLQSSTINNSGLLPINNWSLPTTTVINANLSGGLGGDDGAAAIGDSDVVSVGAGTPGIRPIPAAKNAKVLSGGISNLDESIKTLEHGATLLAPKKATTLNTSFGTVNVAGGSVVMVMAFDGGIAVYNMHDTKFGAVQVKVGDNTVKLLPGQNAVMTSRSIKCFEEINPAQFVSYRNVAAKDWGHGVQGFTSEFSIITMLGRVGALRDLMVKSSDADTRKAMDSMLKTCAILSQMGGQQYQPMVLPPRTAMALK